MSAARIGLGVLAGIGLADIAAWLGLRQREGLGLVELAIIAGAVVVVAKVVR